MLLTLDIGNTNVTIGIFDGEEIRATWRIATDVLRLPDEYAVTILGLLRTEDIAAESVTQAVMASVPANTSSVSVRRASTHSSPRS